MDWFKGSRCTSIARLEHKTVIITGANCGIGKETAVDMAKRGACVIMACRDKRRGEVAVKEVQERSGSAKVALKILDLASLASIQEFAKSFLVEYPRLDILINNGGIGKGLGKKTEDGFEMVMGVNHLGHFALTNLLLERIVQSAPGSRIINVSSIMHQYCSEFNFENINCNNERNAYKQSKLANVLFTKELHRRVCEKLPGIYAFALHPGFVATNVFRDNHIVIEKLVLLLASVFGKSPEQGAQTTIHCAVSEDIGHLSGSYFSDCAVKSPNIVSCDEGVAKKLWEVSEDMTGVNFPL